MLMSTDVASIMLPVNRGMMDRERDIDSTAGPHANSAGASAAVRGMKRGDPEPDAQTAAALTELAGAECKRPRIDGSGGVGDIGQVWNKMFIIEPSCGGGFLKDFTRLTLLCIKPLLRYKECSLDIDKDN